MSERLKKLNCTAPEVVEADFLNCCGSKEWARKMIAARPFETVAALIEKAEGIWRSLEKNDWLEAFAAHPKIGAKVHSPQSSQFAQWSHNEQSGARGAAHSTRSELAEANRLYEDKFGFIFIVCATGKSAQEMLGICRARLGNDANREIFIAADEQRKITEIRLRKLLEIE